MVREGASTKSECKDVASAVIDVVYGCPVLGNKKYSRRGWVYPKGNGKLKVWTA